MDQHSNEQKSDMETDETLTNRQGHPITNNQHIRTVGNRGLPHWRTMISWRRSATLTGRGFPNGSSMQGGRSARLF